MQLTDDNQVLVGATGKSSSDLTLQILSTYVFYCKNLQIPFDESEVETAKQAFKQWMEKYSSWLMIIDNADQPECLESFLPIHSQGHVLLTSRANSFARLGILESIEVQKLPRNEATEFLVKRVSRILGDSEKNFASKLAVELDGLPLALEQAGAYIQEASISFERYLYLFRKLKVELLEEQEPVLGDYKKTVQKTWLMNFKAVENESKASTDLLLFCAYLAPDGIPYELITEGIDYLGDSIQEFFEQSKDPFLALTKLLLPLSKYSLITNLPEKEEFNIHRLVQAVMKVEKSSVEKSKVWIERVLHVLDRVYPNPDYSNVIYCRKFWLHCQVAIELIQDQKIKTKVSGSLLRKQGVFLHYTGEYVKADSYLRKAIEINHDILGENDLAFGGTLNALGALRYNQGLFSEAEELLTKSMRICGSVLGEDHVFFVTPLNNLANLYERQGRLNEAEKLLKRALKICYQNPNEDPIRLAFTLNSLAGLFESQGNYSESEEFYKEAIEIRRAHLGEKHVEYAASLNDLANLYVIQGRYTEAEPLLNQAIDIRTNILGLEDPEYATLLNNLADLYFNQGMFSKAEELYVKAIDIRRDIQGENNPSFASLINNLAVLYQKFGFYKQAEKLYLRSIEIRRLVLGKEHPILANSINNLAGLYQTQKKYMQAERLYKKAIQIRLAALGEGHVDYGNSLNNLASLYLEQGRREDAKPLFKIAMKIVERSLGKDHPDYKIVSENYQNLS